LLFRCIQLLVGLTKDYFWEEYVYELKIRTELFHIAYNISKSKIIYNCICVDSVLYVRNIICLCINTF
jgi:hypothetical protein